MAAKCLLDFAAHQASTLYNKGDCIQATAAVVAYLTVSRLISLCDCCFFSPFSARSLIIVT